MNEGLQWLARQLAWEQNFKALHVGLDTKADEPTATVAQLAPITRAVTVDAPTAAELVGGDQAA
jgi:hypothetical protein